MGRRARRGAAHPPLDHRIPLKGEGPPAPVAAASRMLVKHDYRTGDTGTIDGGLTMRSA